MFVSTISTIQHEFNDDEEKKRENVEGGRKIYIRMSTVIIIINLMNYFNMVNNNNININDEGKNVEKCRLSFFPQCIYMYVFPTIYKSHLFDNLR